MFFMLILNAAWFFVMRDAARNEKNLLAIYQALIYTVGFFLFIILMTLIVGKALFNV